MDTDRLRWHHVFLAAAVLIALAAAVPSDLDAFRDGRTGEAAIIQLDGRISFSGAPSQQVLTPDTVAQLTQRATREGADVIVYEINSGGGAVVASKAIARVIEQAEVPTVCRMKEVAASGAYWAAAACDRIVADSLTTTGSIGVTAAYLEYSGLLQKLGVEYVNLTSGEYKDMGSPFTNLTADERARFDRILGTVHRSFVDYIAEQRDMSRADVDRYATGELLLGERALEAGLVDELGGRETALDVAKNMTGHDRFSTTEYAPPRRLDILSMLFSRIGQGIAGGLSSDGSAVLHAR